MKWFKHYSNARASNALTALFAKTGFEGYGRYWILLEEMSFKFNGEDETFVFVAKDLRDILGFYHTNAMLMYLQCLADVGLMSFECQDNVTTISSTILLELQSRDFKKARSERAETAPKSKKKIKSKDKEEDKEWLLNNAYFKRISPQQQKLHFEAYDLDFLKRETIAAIAFIEKDPMKYMNREDVFLANHFARQAAYQNKNKPSDDKGPSAFMSGVREAMEA